MHLHVEGVRDPWQELGARRTMPARLLTAMVMVAVGMAAATWVLVQAAPSSMLLAGAAALASFGATLWLGIAAWRALGRRAPAHWRHRLVEVQPEDGSVWLQGPWHRVQLPVDGLDLVGNTLLLRSGDHRVHIDGGAGLRGHRRARSLAAALRHAGGLQAA